MKMFECIIDDGRNIFKEIVPAKTKKELLEIYGGNGEFKLITDVTDEYFNNKSADHLEDCLAKTGWGLAERRLIKALLEQHLAKRDFCTPNTSL